MNGILIITYLAHNTAGVIVLRSCAARSRPEAHGNKRRTTHARDDYNGGDLYGFSGGHCRHVYPSLRHIPDLSKSETDLSYWLCVCECVSV